MTKVTADEVMAAMRSGQSAGLVQVMEERLKGMIGKPSGLIETLPKPVQKRIQYLKQLQEDYDAKEAEYDKELEALHKKYEALYAPIFEKRAKVVKGQEEAPADIEIVGVEGDETGPPGIPDFWLNVFRANEILLSQIQEKDEEVLEYLTDVRVKEFSGEDEEGFTLYFDFADNPFFTNTTLVKTYHMAADADDDVLEKAEGTKIDWKSGKNITVKTLKKKSKPGKGSSGRVITKTEKVDSFFNFFSPPLIPENEELDEEEIEELQASLEADYEIGETIRDELVPNAVLWYTGEAVASDEDEDEEDEDDDEEEDEGDSEDDDDEEEDDDEGNDDDDDEDGSAEEDEKPELLGKANPRKGKKPAKEPSDTKEQPAECKQQ